MSAADVAAAWATMAGCVRISGHVTPVPSRMRSVVAPMPPTTLQTNGLCPWASPQGWKWSETIANEKPASSARRAFAIRSAGPCSSDDSQYPNSAMRPSSHARAAAKPA